MNGTGDAYTSVAVMPDQDTALKVRVQVTTDGTVLASVYIGDGFTTTALTMRDKDTLNRLVAVFGEARARFVGAQTRLREPEVPVAS